MLCINHAFSMLFSFNLIIVIIIIQLENYIVINYILVISKKKNVCAISSFP